MTKLIVLFIIVGISSNAQASDLFKKMSGLYKSADRVATWSDFPVKGYMKRQCRFVLDRDSTTLSSIRFYIVDIGSNGPEFPELPENKQIIPWYKTQEVDCELQPWRCGGQNDPANQAARFFMKISSRVFSASTNARDRIWSFRVKGSTLVFQIDLPLFEGEDRYQYGYCF